MTTAYIPPGVTVKELTATTLTPLLAVPGSICFVGMSAGTITRTDTIQLFGTVPTVLPGVPAGSSLSTSAVVSIIDALQPSINPNGYAPSTDYTFSNTNYTITRQITSQTLVSNAAAAATSFTLTAGAVPSNGQVVNLTTQVSSFTANTHNTNVVDGISSMTGLAVGQVVLGTGIPGGTTILAVNVSTNSLILSNPVSTSATAVSLTANNVDLVTVSGVAGQIVSISNAGGLIYAHASGSTTVSWGNIPDGTTAYVSYQYTPADYFNPIRLTSMTDIQNRFGNVWDVTGTIINSPISFAANMAFQNGASNVVLQPLYFLNQSTGLRQQPTPTQAATPSNWSTVFNNLLTLTDINILVPVIGQSAASVSDAVMLQVEQAAQDFVYQALNAENQYVFALVGEDSSASSSVAQEPTLQAHAQTIAPRYGGAVTEQMAFISNSNFATAAQATTIQIGGQYVAAAVAGMLSARRPSAPITRQAVSGILSVTDQRTLQQKNSDAANGMLVVENRGNIVWVRHGLTMNMSNAATREINVVRAKHFVIQSIQQTLETQVIGQLVADANAPTLLNNLIIATLEDLRAAQDLSAYRGVASQITSIDPTAMAVQFAYLPLFIVNYVNVTFQLDLTNQTVTATSTTATASNG